MDTTLGKLNATLIKYHRITNSKLNINGETCRILSGWMGNTKEIWINYLGFCISFSYRREYIEVKISVLIEENLAVKTILKDDLKVVYDHELRHYISTLPLVKSARN